MTKRLPAREKTSKVHTLWPKDCLPGNRQANFTPYDQKTASQGKPKQISYPKTKRLPPREKKSKIHTLWPKDCLPGKRQANFKPCDQKTASQGKDKQSSHPMTKRLPPRENPSKFHPLWPKDCLPGKRQANFTPYDQKTASQGKPKQISYPKTKRLPAGEKTGKFHSLWPKDCLPGKIQADGITSIWWQVSWRAYPPTCAYSSISLALHIAICIWAVQTLFCIRYYHTHRSEGIMSIEQSAACCKLGRLKHNKIWSPALLVLKKSKILFTAQWHNGFLKRNIYIFYMWWG